jgi:hypothetical protein
MIGPLSGWFQREALIGPPDYAEFLNTCMPPQQAKLNPSLQSSA